MFSKTEDNVYKNRYTFHMLEFIKISQPNEIHSFLKKFEPNEQTWIVSDLKSKQEIQNESVRRFGFYTDDSVMRISDFWRLWMRRLDPAMNVVSSDFIKALVQSFVDTYGDELKLGDAEATTLFSYVQELAPLIIHPESQRVVAEWIEAQDEVKKWSEWFLLARTCIRYIIDKNKVIDAKWSAAYLQNLDLNLLNWPNEMIVDLGTELSSIEMGLFKVLSQKQKIRVLVPFPQWHTRYRYILKTYQENFGYGYVTGADWDESTQKNDLLNSKNKFIRLSTQLAEVKYAVAQVRQWLDDKIEPSSIAIIAPDIETYWSSLKMYLDSEGIRANKDKVVSLNGVGEIQYFLAKLKNFSTEVSWETLEQTYFNNRNNPDLNFEKFKSIFFQLFSDEDLKRHEVVQNIFYKKINFNELISRNDFLVSLIKIWMNQSDNLIDSKYFEVLIKDFLGQSLETKMSFHRWTQFLKSRVSRKEIKIENGYIEGIKILPIMSAQMIDCTHRIYIGLYEEAFNRKSQALIPIKDIEALKNQFDLAIDYPDENYLDFNLRWQNDIDNIQHIYTTPHLGFAADPLTTSLFFLENQPQSNVVVPNLIRHDEMQKKVKSFYENKLLLSEIEPWLQSCEVVSKVSLQRLQQDLVSEDINIINKNRFQKLSVSEIDQYSKCHFKLLASKGFRLRDFPQVSIDLDPRQKGTIAHSLFEFCIKLTDQPQLNENEVTQFLDEQRNRLNLFKNEDHFWQVQKNKLLVLASQFYKFEKERKLKFLSTVEVPFEIYFDSINNQFTLNKTETTFTLSGRIDRVDYSVTKKYLLIYDYKTSLRQAVPYKKWLDEKEFQLLLYLMAVEQILERNSTHATQSLWGLKIEDVAVKGALFYLYKNFNLTKGIIDKEIGLEDLLFSKRVGSLIENDDFTKLKNDFKIFLIEALLEIKNGHFSVKPFNTDICQECDWSKLCRATHLM